MIKPEIYINAIGLVNALGHNNDAILKSLEEEQTGLVYDDSYLLNQLPTYLGKIQGSLPKIPREYYEHDSRNNQILLAALEQIKPYLDECLKSVDSSRVAVIMGTSTSGIAEGESALQYSSEFQDISPKYQYQQQRFSDPSDFLAKYLKITGPNYTISTACSSSARAVISGATLIEAGIVDIAIVGGADSLCKMAINGFHALESLSSQPCTPFAQDRSGINIGEAGGLILLSKQPSKLRLYGWGASSDAWHISAPHPEGKGAAEAIVKALNKANLVPDDIGYINCHGTGTPLNDSAESKAIFSLFGDKVPCSSTKHLTGHTLGAAGITELGIAALLLDSPNHLPRQIFTANSPCDQSLPTIQFVDHSMKIKQPMILSNSFAFGGNNVSLIVGKN